MESLEKKPKGKTIKNSALLTLCAALIIFYLQIMVWGKQPDVPIEYEMYYITHELKDWPGYGKLAYESGTIEYCTSADTWSRFNTSYKICARKGSGWNPNQSIGSVNDNAVSHIYYVPESAGSNAELKLRITEFEGSGKVRVYKNDEYVGEFLDKGDKTVIIPEFDEEELVKITFAAEDCKFTLLKISLEW
ncbi:MAG: hypothetical protein ACLSW1_01955 [Lachnospira sp.]